MTAKRDAHLAAAAADQPRVTFPVPKPIHIHLTPFAPELHKHPIGDRKRWVTLYGRTPEQGIRALLKRLRMAPEVVTTSTDAAGDVSILAPVPPEFLDLVSSEPGEPAAFAIIWDSLTEDQVRTVLADLKVRRWKPDVVSEFVHA